MKRFDLPASATLVDGSSVKLAPIALNRRFIRFMEISQGADTDPGAAVSAMLDVLGDCIRHGNPELSVEQAEERREMIPLNFVMDLLDDGPSGESDLEGS